MARVSTTLLLLSLLAASRVLAADGTSSPSLRDTTLPPLDELVVHGKKLYERRAEIFKAEDRFYALYNKLNTNHDFDVNCDEEATTGSRFVNRVCRPVYIAKAEEEEARALLLGYSAPPATLVAQMRRDDYRKNLIEAVQLHPELLQLLRARYEMEQQYQKDRREKFKGHWILWE